MADRPHTDERGNQTIRQNAAEAGMKVGAKGNRSLGQQISRAKSDKKQIQRTDNQKREGKTTPPKKHSGNKQHKHAEIRNLHTKQRTTDTKPRTKQQP